MVKILFYREAAHEDLPSLGKIAKLFEMDYIIVDPSGEWSKKSKTKGLFYNNLQEAIDDPIHKDYTWVFLSEKAKMYLDKFEHPKDNVIYCAGDDVKGFYELDIFKWNTLAVRPADGEEWFASVCLQIAIYDRYLRLK